MFFWVFLEPLAKGWEEGVEEIDIIEEIEEIDKIEEIEGIDKIVEIEI